MLLWWIQFLHAIISVYNFFCLLYMMYAHIRGRKTLFLKVAYVSIAIEIIVLIPFKFICPIRVLVDHLYSPQTSDIMFPWQIAQWFIEAGLVLLFIAIILRIIFWKRNVAASKKTRIQIER